MTGPLQGVKVIDCSRGTAGPRVTGVLADYGADVIWVEPPGGDPCRQRLAPEYSVFNRGKRSVVLDLHDPAGNAELFELLATADVFVQSWRPGVADRFGLDYQTVHERRPGLVYCEISGFGLDGPHRDLAGHESLVHAVIGTMAEQVGHRDGPIYEGLPFAAIGASYLALIGLLGALYRRHHDGAGRLVETSLVDGALAYLSMMWGTTDASPAPPLSIRAGTGRLIAATFRCADERYVGVHTGAVGAFGRLMKVLGLDDRIPSSESGLDMGVPLTEEQREVLETEIHQIFASQPCSTWVSRLRDADICAIPHFHPTEVFDEPQVRHNEMVLELDDPVLGPVQQVAPPIKFALTPATVAGPAPSVGQPSGEALAAPPPGPLAPWPTPSASVDTGPLLDGLRILDLGGFYAGPYASRLLADLGAEVIKVEPVAGDPLHGLERPFRSAQAGKRALAANLKDPALEPAIQRLITWADVVQHNMRPGAAERLGLGYERVHELNPAAVYVYSPGWGSTGPDRDRQSFAPMMSGYVGVGFEVAGQFNEPLFPVGNEDPGAGLVGAVAILMALVRRQRTGQGQYVESPQLNAALAHLAHIVRRPDGTAIGAGRLDPLQVGVGALDRLYQTADGWVCIVATGDEQIASMGQVIGVDLLGDARFATSEARERNDYELSSLIGETLEKRKTDEWLADLAASGVPAAAPKPYNNVTFMTDPENERSGRVAVCAHPTEERVRELAVLVRVSDAEIPTHQLAPSLGQHTDEILSWLGYDASEIADLRARGQVT
jgi:crotonobetainyl-CoA:carnitine CoA-transferase CaiB-like acyl-CoA transferase